MPVTGTKGLLSVVVGNTPESRGGLIAELRRTHPESVVLSVSVQEGLSGRYPVVQRLMSPPGKRLTSPASLGSTGDPVVILRQDLVSLRRAENGVHVILALPEQIDLLPFLVQLWRARLGADSLEDHYEPALVLAGISPDALLTDICCVHRAVQVWGGGDHREPLTPAEISARQVEAADALVIAGSRADDDEREQAAGALLRHLNPRAGVVTLDRVVARRPASGRVLTRAQAPEPMRAQWEARLEPLGSPYASPAPSRDISTVVWRARRPLHPERLADALGEVMCGVLRSRGQLWLASRPDAVVTWRSAGGHLEIREADRWLEADSSPAWQAASPLRRTLACWYWDEQNGERRNEIVFTGTELDLGRITNALDGALLDHAEFSMGREGWLRLRDPLLGEV
ncbi:GTP-binding protein [Streptomyces ardesiacus]